MNLGKIPIIAEIEFLIQYLSKEEILLLQRKIDETYSSSGERKKTTPKDEEPVINLVHRIKEKENDAAKKRCISLMITAIKHRNRCMTTRTFLETPKHSIASWYMVGKKTMELVYPLIIEEARHIISDR
jgi:hypothetical protein